MRTIAIIRRILRDDQSHVVDLTRHFFRRFFDSEFISKDAEAHLGVVNILALLAVPGVFYTLSLPFYYDYIHWRHSQALFDAVSTVDQCRYLLFSMAVIGMVAVVEWDRLFPDRRDYAILMPLPLKPRTIFSTKAAALLLFISLFVLAVAALPAVFYPLIEVEGLPGDVPLRRLAWMASVHAVAVFSGCLFMFLFFIALRGVLILFLSYSQARRVSLYVQGLATVFLVCQFFLVPLVPKLLPVWENSHRGVLYAFPPMWFLGLYRTLLGDHHVIFLSLARIAIIASILMVGITAATYLACYRRYTEIAFESPEGNKRSSLGISKLIGWPLDRLWLKDGPERATFYFVLKTLARNAKHRLYLVTFVSVGLSLALLGILGMMVHSSHGSLWHFIGQPSQALLAIPLVISFFALVGMRATFNLPAELPANWVFQMSGQKNVRGYLAGVRKNMVAVAIIPLFTAAFAAYAFAWGLGDSLLAVSFGVLLSLILMEILLYSFHKIPFTCSHVPGKLNLPLAGIICWLVFAFYAYSMASLEKWMFQQPIAWVIAFGTEALILERLITHRNHSLPDGVGVQFEDQPAPAVQTLDLNA